MCRGRHLNLNVEGETVFRLGLEGDRSVSLDQDDKEEELQPLLLLLLFLIGLRCIGIAPSDIQMNGFATGV